MTELARQSTEANHAEEKCRAVADALVELGENAPEEHVVELVKARSGMSLDLAEMRAIRTRLGEHARQPPAPDQPPPEGARRVLD